MTTCLLRSFAPLITGFLLLVCSLSMAADEEPIRTWTSKAGSDLKARLVSSEDEQVVLANEQGRTMQVPLVALSDNDQAYIQKWLMDQDELYKSRAILVKYAKRKTLLPMVEEGPWIGSAAVVIQPRYTFILHADLDTTLYVKELGKDVGPALQPLMTNFWIRNPTLDDPRDRRWRNLPVESYSSPSQPLMNPKEVRIQGVLTNQSPFEITYTFTPDSIHAKVTIEKAQRDPEVAIGNLNNRILASNTFDRSVTMEEQKRVLKGYEVELETANGKKSIAYWESTSSANASRIQAKGPWGRTGIRFDTEGNGRERISFSVYPGIPAYSGYRVGRSADYTDTGNSEVELTLKFE